MRRAIGYIRVSTQGQADEGVSLQTQKSKIKAWCELNDYELLKICSDAGISGKRIVNRLGLQDALKSVGEGDAIVVYSLSRLARSTRDTLDISDLLSQKGADLVSLSESIDTTTAAGKMVFRMLAVLSEFERDQLSERTRCALKFKKDQGFKCGGDCLFGFTADKEGRLTENPGEQRIIALVKDLRGKGYTLRGICQELQNRGYRNRKGVVRWHPMTVKRIIGQAA